MQFTITRTNLLKGLGAVSRLAAQRMPLPILNNILIEGESSGLIFSVTDLELGIQVKVPAKVEKAGKFTVPARLFHEFIQNSTDAQFEGKVSDNATLSLTSEHSGVKIRGLDASEFPGLPFTDGKSQVTVSAKEFKAALEQTLFASAIDDTRPVLAGIFLKSKDTELLVVATDSYRLAEKQLKTTNPVSGECSAIIPKKVAFELVRLLSDEAGEISVFVGDNQIQFGFNMTKIVSRLIEGNYPNYTAIIPNGYQTRVTAHLGDLITSLKTAQLFAREAGNMVKLQVQPGAGMIVQSVADQKGEATNTLTAIAEGDELLIAFNVKYLLDALSVIQADNIFVEFAGPDKPAVIRPTNSKEYLSLAMPLKVD